MRPYHPYLVDPNPMYLDRQLLPMLGTGQVARNLTNLTLAYGERNTVGLANIFEQLEVYGSEVASLGMDIFHKRANTFVGADHKYQEALLAYRDAIASGSAARVLARQRVLNAFNTMQKRFRWELKMLTGSVKARKGIPLTSTRRAINIAKSSRKNGRLLIADQVEASRLVRLASGLKFLGNGVAIFKFADMSKNIYQSYEGGGNWERKMFIDCSSFATSGALSIAAADAGEAALGFILAAHRLAG